MHNGSPEGVLFMTGPNIKEGTVIKDASIMDITPTVLYLLGFEVLAAMDGKVLETAFEADYLKGNRVRIGKKGTGILRRRPRMSRDV